MRTPLNTFPFLSFPGAYAAGLAPLLELAMIFIFGEFGKLLSFILIFFGENFQFCRLIAYA